MNDYKSIQELIVKAALYDEVSTTISASKLVYGVDVLAITFSKGDRHIAILIDLGYENKTHQEEVNLNVCKRALRDLLFAPYDEIEVKKENHHESM